MLSREEHIARHKELHRYLDELVADWITHTGKLPSTSSVFELMMWSSSQIDNPTEKGQEHA